MKKIVVVDGIEITYKENIWTGAKELLINGKAMIKKNKNEYCDDYRDYLIKRKGFMGLELVVKEIATSEEKVFEIVRPINGLEIVLSLIPFFFVIIFGNVVSFVEMFPIVGGAIGGAISGGIFGLEISLFRKSNKMYVSLIIGIVGFIVCLMVCHLVALLILSAL